MTTADAGAWLDRATALGESAQAGDYARLDRGALWCEVEDVASRETSGEIAAEAGVSFATWKAELWVSRAWGAHGPPWPYPLPWSHYRATAKRDLDDTVRHDLMRQAVLSDWTEADLKRAVRDVLARDGAGDSATGGAPPDPADYDDWTGYAVARLVEGGMPEARAASVVADVARYGAEWRTARGEES